VENYEAVAMAKYITILEAPEPISSVAA